MSIVDKALATQITNIEARTGKTLAELVAHVATSGSVKHRDIVNMLKSDFGLGYGDANTIAHLTKQPASPVDDPSGDPLDALYVGPKATLRPIHDALLGHIEQFGSFETAPKKTYVSYRRKRQFAMIGPATKTRVELGLNIKELPDSERLDKLPAGKMCNFQVRLTDVTQVDDELISWVKAAYDAA